MYTELLKNKIFEQAEVYQELKNKSFSNVQYKQYRDETYGTQDSNYVNRMRLAYYFLYANIDDERAVVYLFREELRDRNNNSFQGIGNSLNVLTTLVNRYNLHGKYDELFEQAKNANFDCACGYDKDCQIDSDIRNLGLLDCIFLSQELEYKDVMEIFVNTWKENVEEWNENNRIMLIKFNAFLGKEQENEEVYLNLLEDVLKTGKINSIVSSYNKIIRYYLSFSQFDMAYYYFKQMIEKTNYEEIKRIRLFGDVLEACFEIICAYSAGANELWKWAKPYLQNTTNRYGNLYTKGIEAAKCVNDSYAIHLEKEYVEWKKKVGLK